MTVANFHNVFSVERFALAAFLAGSLTAFGCDIEAPTELESRAQGVQIDLLTAGKTKSGLSGEKDNWTVYQLDVPFGADELIVEIYGGTGDADLILRRDQPPTPTQYDFHLGRKGNSEFKNFAVPGGGTWYIALLGYKKYENVTLWTDYHLAGTPGYLPSGVTKYGLAGTKDSWKYYRIYIPTGTSEFRVKSKDGFGSCNLFVNRGSKPNQFFYDEKRAGGGTWKNITISDPIPGLYFIGLQGGTGGYSDVDLRPQAF